MKILEPRNFYKPFEYPWANDLWRKHESMHWMGHSVQLDKDVRDWRENLTDAERNLLTHLFRFFTQADVDVAAGYTKKFLPYFSHKPELAMMMASFAAREAVHIDAYALLLETVGMPETTYNQFQNYKEMKDKHDFVEQFGMDTPEAVLKSLAVYSAFTEGMQLFASFVVLLNFARFNKMKNMSNIVAWSIKDENLHVEGMTRLFREMFKEKPEGAVTHLDIVSVTEKQDFIDEIAEIAYKMVELEDAFIDLIFSDSEAIQGLSPGEVKDYIRYISNGRWKQLGFEGKLFDIDKNPLPWVDVMVNGEEHNNFFEQKSTEYSKAMTKGSLSDVDWS